MFSWQSRNTRGTRRNISAHILNQLLRALKGESENRKGILHKTVCKKVVKEAKETCESVKARNTSNAEL